MTNVIKLKCMACSLHFIVCSDDADWQPNHCPECGSHYPFMAWRETTNEQIYQLVPGHTELSEMGAGRKPITHV